MFKLYSKGCEYTLRALIHFPMKDSEKKLSPTIICKKAKIPKSYTQKIFQLLTQKGILHSTPGPGGGYSLAINPDKVTLLSLIKAIDGDNTFDRCVMGLNECSEKSPCPIHHTWIIAKNSLIDELSKKTLKQLMHAGINKKIVSLDI